ncbi:MAG: hypothetical protein NTZ18_02140 [Candidatus Komeilibacteria bacterium]|nr:hypothetical protein [Candidatus Komeilibacteria bacterium]
MVLFIGEDRFEYKRHILTDSNGHEVAKGTLVFGEIEVVEVSPQTKKPIKVRVSKLSKYAQFDANVLVYRRKPWFWPFGKKVFSFISDQQVSLMAK